MELKSLVKELNKSLELEPPIPLDNEKGTLAELSEVCSELLASDVEHISRNAARELIKMKLVDAGRLELAKALYLKAGREIPKDLLKEEKPAGKKAAKPKNPEPEEAPETPAPKKKQKVEPEPEEAPKKKKEKTAPEARSKQESAEDMAYRLMKTGKDKKDLIEELRDRFTAKGKNFNETWLNKRADIYWGIANKRRQADKAAKASK